MDNYITLKSINDLLKEKFIIPSYQRGYRWTESQVTDLLNDILDFFNTNKSREEFYCLQPLMVTKKEDETEWEVIDGQQRITTVYLILNYFNQRLTPEFRKELYSINYKTRTKSVEFLQNPNPDSQNDNIDFHYIYKAAEVIKNWFSDKAQHINDFEATLLNRTKFIWYEAEIKDDSEAINIFTRINIGKIPLTNAELIKALFLNRNNFDDNRVTLNQIQIASEWDVIQFKLQDNSFWNFIFGENDNYETRIEYIFDLLVGKKSTEKDPHYTFITYKEQFDSNTSNVSNEWNRIKKYFLTFEEWFNDKYLYHIIGYLIATGYKLFPLIEYSDKLRKNEFRNQLKKIISERISCKASDLDEYDYNNNSSKIKPILLLFNIESILSNPNSNVRFPYDKFKSEQWDIEHIRAIKSNKPKASEQREWLHTIINYFKEVSNGTQVLDSELTELISESNKLLELDKWQDESDFDTLYDKWLTYFNESDEPENINNLGNLTLLDLVTNRSYKNSVFPIKRNVIISKDKTATFVPICTKNVFLKYYSPNIDNMMYWGANDMNYYLKAIKSTLKDYLKPETNTHGT